MDFKKTCQQYNKHLNKLQGSAQALLLVRQSYELLQLKRLKLKTGATTFSFKSLSYGGIVLCYWFELEFTAQSGPNKSRSDMERVLKLLKWSYNLTTLLLLTTTFLIVFTYLNYLLDYYIQYFICFNVNSTTNHLLITHLFDMDSCEILQPWFSQDSHSPIVDLILYHELL